MNTSVQALKALYIKLGGVLTDTYSDIANGIAVGDYTVIPDCIGALSKVASQGGGGSENVYLAEITVDTDTGNYLLTDGAEAVYEQAQTKAVVGILAMMGNVLAMPLTLAMKDVDDYIVEFTIVYEDEGISTLKFVNNAAGETTEFAFLPDSPGDGKILMGKNGEWREISFIDPADGDNFGKLVGVSSGSVFEAVSVPRPMTVNIDTTAGTCDTSQADIVREMAANGVVAALIDNGAYVLYATCIDGINVIFSGVITDNATVKIKVATVASDGTATVTDYTPTVS